MPNGAGSALRLIALAAGLAFGAGCGTQSETPAAPTPTPVALRGFGVQINPGAVVPIFDRADPLTLGSALGSAHPYEGLFTDRPEAIHLAHRYEPVAGILLHEYQHLLEHRLRQHPDRDPVEVAREAFRDLCGPTFELGASDLMDDAVGVSATAAGMRAP